MLEYEWGTNPSQIILTTTEDGATHDNTTAAAANSNNTTTPDPHHHLFQHYSTITPHHHHQNTHSTFDLAPTPTNAHHIFASPPTNAFPHFTTTAPSHEQHYSQNVHSMFDPRGCLYGVTPSYPHHPPNNPSYSLDSFACGGGGGGSSSNHGFLIVPKTEELGRLGLNLGGRTYFSSSEDDFVNRLYRRSSRPADPGSMNMNVPRCQAEGCNADLTHAKHYHRRHKVCEFHSKAAAVIAAGLTQRFCQQCSRFHLLSEFDNGKRSCRKRLADHNRRRRKSHQPHQEIQIKSQPENAVNNITSTYNLSKSPADSGTQSASSVTIAVSPPKMSLDSFRQRPHHQTTASSASSCSLFFPTG